MAELQRSRNDRRLVTAMITLARNLGKIVIADGVENTEQKEWLVQSGCDHMQGNYFAEPQRLDDIFTTLRDNLAPN